MSYLILALLGLAASAALIWSARAETAEMRIRWPLVGVVAFFPLLMASCFFYFSREAVDTYQISYVGKRIAFGPGTPITAGGSSPDSPSVEDLRASLLPPNMLRIEPATPEMSQEVEGLTVDEPALRLASSSSIVRIDGRLLNSYALQEGDRIRLEIADPPIELELTAEGLRRGNRLRELPSSLSRLFRGTSVLHLPDLLAELAPDLQSNQRDRVRSLLYRPGFSGPWQLVIRESTTSLARGPETFTMQRLFALDRQFDLSLQVTWGAPNRRTLRTVRSDRIEIEAERALIRFGEPQTRLVETGGLEDTLELGLVTPTSIDRRPHLIEFDEPSRRFLGASATLRFTPGSKEWELELFGDRRTLRPDELYALGEGPDQLLVHSRRSFNPTRVRTDLLLYGLYVLTFLGQAMTRRPLLAAVVAPTGILLASRILFSERVAASPPDFDQRIYAEARIALWLIPAALLLAWSLAWLVQKAQKGPVRFNPLRWPLVGLLVASIGSVATTQGMGNLSLLAIGPLLGCVLLVLLARLTHLQTVQDHLASWGTGGWCWDFRTAALAGVLIVMVRGVASFLGMPETLRLPSINFRVLWTVVQLPLCAFVIALTAERIERLRKELPGLGPQDLSQKLKGWFSGIVSLGFFLGLAFVAVALLVRDTGLFLAHGLTGIFTLLLLVVIPRAFRDWERPSQALYATGLLLALAPMILVVAFNARPGWMVSLVGWGSEVEASTLSSEGVVDRAAQVSSTRAQQIFRIYMLANPEDLSEIGLRPSEQVAIHYQTLRAYAVDAGRSGNGYATSEIPRHLGRTYLSDLVPMVFVLADFGRAGMLGLTVVYLGLLALVALAVNGIRGPTDPFSRQGGWIALIAALAFCLPSLYMILANLNLVLFTGKNCNLLSLNSTSDVLESGALLALAAFGLGLRRTTP